MTDQINFYALVQIILDFPYTKPILSSLLVLLVILLSIKVVNFISYKLVKKIKSLQGTKIKALSWQKVTFISEIQLVHGLSFAVLFVRKVFIFFLLLWCLFLTVGFFTSLEFFLDKILFSVESSVKHAFARLFEYLPHLLLIVAVVAVTLVLLRWIKLFFKEVEHERIRLRHFHSDWAPTTSRIVQWALVIFALTLIIPNLPGSDSNAFKGISIFVGILVSLGSTSAVRNAVAGIVLTYMRSFRVRDFVSVAGTMGTVVDKGFLSTRVLTPYLEEVSIPNVQVLDNQVTNYSTHGRMDGVIFHTKITVVYNVPWRQVESLLIEAARRTDGVLEQPKPFMLHSKLHDFYVEYELSVYVKRPEKWIYIYSDLHKNIQDVFAEAKVDLTTPTHLYLRQSPASSAATVKPALDE